jgi:tetratricopeptide (TPR) repeat protein
VTGALVSGQARVAVFLEGSQAWCIQSQSPSPRPVSPGLLPYLFGDITCASYHPEATLTSTGELLARACREERGLHLALISMDPASSETTCELADDALEDLLEHPHVSEFIENRLFSKRLPENALWRAKETIDGSRSNVKLDFLKRSVVGAQEAVGKVRAAWDALPEDVFAEADDRADLESVLVETGAFRVLAKAVAEATNRQTKGEAQLRLLSDHRYQAFAGSRKILLEWTKAIPSVPRVSELLVREEPDDESLERRQDEPLTVAPFEAYQNVIRQKEAILDQLAKRNFQKVERFAEDLVRDQLSQERYDLAAKSLCDLATSAKQLGFPAYELAWCSRAKEINPDDRWVHRQFADALLGQGDLPGALQAYETTLRDSPEDAVARNGKAEVLKAMGRLPEALETYEATVRNFPENDVARSGRAEVLKAMGRLPEALDAYEAAVRDFPESAVARSGRAEVLKAMGRLPEALDAYEATIRDFPEDAVARSGEAEVLKAMGRLPEALEAYEAGLRDFPQDVFVRNGKAEVLKAMGRLPEALGAYEASLRDFPHSAVARCGKAEVLKVMGRLLEALEGYEATVRDFPRDAVARDGKAEVLKAMGRLPEALVAYEATTRDFPEDAVARTGKAEVLKAMGRLPEALEAYETTLRDFPENVFPRNGKAEVLKAMGRLPEALMAYESTVRDVPHDAVARNGRADVLKAMGRLPEALEAYEATLRNFPGGVFARNGKAEVLKSMGRLPEALEAYEATIRDFPESAVARTGRATLLVLLGRYEEAAALVRTDRTQTRDEWIGFHIRASIKLKQNSLDEADRLLSTGTRCPWADVRSRFIGARAVLRIKRKQLKEADALIRSEPSLESKVIQIDIYRRMKKVGEANAVLRELRGCSVAKIVEISRDLERNMRPGKRTVSDDEFLDRELELLLVAA